MQKQCTKCKIIKDISEFSYNRSKKDGVQNECKVCVALYYKEHKAEILKKVREYYKGHKSEKAKCGQDYYNEHKIEIAKRSREYYKWHKAERAKQRREYLQTNNGRMANKMHQHRRRGLKKNLEATLTTKQWAYILDIQNNRCNKCGRKFTECRPPTMDHIIPLSLGGPTTSENIQALCRSCNSSKNAKLEYKYIQVWNV